MARSSDRQSFKVSKDISVGCSEFAQAAAACYEQWIIFCGISQPARAAVLSIVPGARLLLLDEFVRTEVMPAITRWRATQQAGSNTTPSLPADKWLGKLMEWLDYLWHAPPLAVLGEFAIPTALDQPIGC